MNASIRRIVSFLAMAGFLSAQDAPDQAPAGKSSAPSAEAEEAFRRTLTNSVLEGRWCPVGEGNLGDDRDEKYEIRSVERTEGDSWVIHARMRYRQVDLTLPVPVQVKWAGDTPVIVVDNVGIPGGNKYSARVMIYNGTYSGTWSGGTRGGLLHGLVKPAADSATKADGAPESDGAKEAKGGEEAKDGGSAGN